MEIEECVEHLTRDVPDGLHVTIMEELCVLRCVEGKKKAFLILTPDVARDLGKGLVAYQPGNNLVGVCAPLPTKKEEHHVKSVTAQLGLVCAVIGGGCFLSAGIIATLQHLNWAMGYVRDFSPTSLFLLAIMGVFMLLSVWGGIALGREIPKKPR